MPTRRSSASSFGVVAATGMSVMDRSQGLQPGPITSRRSRAATAKAVADANNYICAIERNQNGKYNVRVQAVFNTGGLKAWMLPVYFLVSSFNAAMRKLEESLQILQKNEERLRFWAVERTDDPKLAGDFLQEFGLRLDRRRQFPRKVAELAVARERAVPASMLAAVRRVLADAVAQERRVSGQALASD